MTASDTGQPADRRPVILDYYVPGADPQFLWISKVFAGLQRL